MEAFRRYLRSLAKCHPSIAQTHTHTLTDTHTTQFTCGTLHHHLHTIKHTHPPTINHQYVCLSVTLSLTLSPSLNCERRLLLYWLYHLLYSHHQQSIRLKKCSMRLVTRRSGTISPKPNAKTSSPGSGRPWYVPICILLFGFEYNFCAQQKRRATINPEYVVHFTETNNLKLKVCRFY